MFVSVDVRRRGRCTAYYNPGVTTSDGGFREESQYTVPQGWECENINLLSLFSIPSSVAPLNVLQPFSTVPFLSRLGNNTRYRVLIRIDTRIVRY